MKPRTKFAIGGALLAKCASRYENAPEKYRDTPGYKSAAKGA